MAEVFISYASKDAIFADLTKMKLKEAGVRVWLDHGELRGGEEWRDSIDNGIANADVMLVILTPKSCDSPYVTYEWGFALGKGKKVIPILLEDSTIHPRLEVLQYLDFRDPRSGPWNELFDEIKTNTEQNVPDGNGNAMRVGDMTSEDLQEIIVGAVALANATAKSAGHAAGAEEFSRAAESVVGVVRDSTQADAETRKRHVLWVDDRPGNNIFERGAFEAIGFTFALALSTNEALDLLKKQSFDAIISDMGRKEGPQEGYVLLDALRQFDQDTPFFIYAGSNAPKHKRQAAELGAQGSTNSPQELFELVAAHVK